MEVSEEVGYGSNNIGKVLPGGGPGGATLWVRNMGDVGSNSHKA